MGKQPTNNWGDFQTKIIQKARELIPLKKKSEHPWWNSNCDNAIEERQRAFLNYNCDKSETTQQTFFEVRKQTAKILRQTKREYLNEQLNSIEEDFRNHTTHKIFTKCLQIKSKDTLHETSVSGNRMENWH